MATRRRKKKREEEPQEEVKDPSLCRVSGCPHPAATEDRLCYFHFLLDKTRAHVERSFAGGEVTFEGLLGLGGAAVAQRLLGRFLNDVPQPQQQAPPRPANGKLPVKIACAVLGLDPGKMTVEDVRAIQRELAKLYHPDRCGAAVSAAKMKEINAAAEACLEHLKAAG